MNSSDTFTHVSSRLDADLGRAHRTRHSEMARRKSVKIPREGTYLKVTNVFDIYKQVRLLVGMLSNLWAKTQPITTCFRLAMPGLVRVHTGKEIHIVSGFLLQEMDSLGSHSWGDIGVHDPFVHDVHLPIDTIYFKHILILLKLRWLLRLHSACCELDYKMCSLKNLILGLQYVVLQQYEEASCDNIFEKKFLTDAGAHLNLDSMVDDLVDQLQRALGIGWKPFLEFTASCDSSRCLMHSMMDSPLTPDAIAPLDTLAVAVDTTFVANFLRQSQKDRASRLRELYRDMQALDIPLPDIPPLRGAPHLQAWAKAHLQPTRLDRERGATKENDKLAQLDAVLLTFAVEMHEKDLEALPEEMSNCVSTSLAQLVKPTGDLAPEPVGFGSTGRKPGSAGPPSAKVLLEDKPQLSPALFDAVVIVIHHHGTFPTGIRERLYNLLMEEYGLTEEQSQRLAIAATQNIDGPRLPKSQIIKIQEKEKTRLWKFHTDTNRDTRFLLTPPLVSSPLENGKTPKYATSPTPPVIFPFPSAIKGTDMARSWSEFNFREPFKVPKLTGPLTMDPDLHKLRTTGFFIRMPPLSPL